MELDYSILAANCIQYKPILQLQFAHCIVVAVAVVRSVVVAVALATTSFALQLFFLLLLLLLLPNASAISLGKFI